MRRSKAVKFAEGCRAVSLVALLLVLSCGKVAFGLVVPGHPHNLTRFPGLDGRPSGSPEGKFCVFASARAGPVGLYVLHLEALTVRPLIVPTREGEFCDHPSWSPKGDLIAFASNMGGREKPDIFVIEPTGGKPRTVVESPAVDWMPTFSPDGRWILFASDREGRSSIYRVSLEGGQPELVVREAWDPAWSPKGELIAYTAVRGGKVGIYISKPDGSGERLVSEGAREPCFSPEGGMLLFVKGSGEEAALFVAPVAGPKPGGRFLFSAKVPLSFPNWPASGIVLFEANVAEEVDVWRLPIRRESPQAKILSPKQGEVLRGMVNITGTAKAPQGMLLGWRLELLPLWRPEKAFTLAEGAREVEEALLAQWDTGGMTGTYGLRLLVEDVDGDKASEQVKVRIFGAYGVEYLEANIPAMMVAGRAYKVKVKMRNLGSMTWRATGGYAVSLRYLWRDEGRKVVAHGTVGPLLKDVPMGGEVEVGGEVVAPREPGRYVLKFDLLQGEIIAFSEQGCPPLEAGVEVVVPYLAQVASHDLPKVLASGQVYSVKVRVENAGASAWEELSLSYRWLDANGRELDIEPLRAPIEVKVEPGREADLVLPVKAPVEVGRFTLVFQLVGQKGEVLVAAAGQAEVMVCQPYLPSLRILWLPLRLEPGGMATIDVEVRNNGILPLPSSGPGRAGVWAAFLDRDTARLVSPGLFTPLAEEVPPGGTAIVRARVPVPQEPGDYLLRVEVRKFDGTLLGGRAEARVSVARRAFEVGWELLSLPSEMVVDQPAVLKVRLTNLGSMRWPSKGDRKVRVRPQFLDTKGHRVVSTTLPADLPYDIGCGESVDLEVEVVAPSEPGRYLLELDLEQEGVGFFSQFGCETPRVPVAVLLLYAVTYLSHDTPPLLVAGQSYTVRIRVRNDGALLWEPSGPGAVCLSYRILTPEGKVIIPMGPTAPLPRQVRMNEEEVVVATLRAPKEQGRYVVIWDLLHGGEVWFSGKGARVLEVEVEVR